MAILVRASFQMREFEDRFVTLGLNYRVIGGPRFYERMEIRDALAYLRATANPADDLAFERIVNTPKRGLGASTIQLIHGHARARDIPLMAAAGELVADGGAQAEAARRRSTDLLKSFARWSEAVGRMRHTDLAEMILEESGYTEMWQMDRSAEAPGRLENLKELINNMGEYEFARRLPGARLAGHGRGGRRGGRGRLDHDAAFRQGAGVRHRLPARLGGRAVPAPAHRSTRTARPGSRRSAASPMSA